MANFSRWFNYAKARLDAAIGQGHRDLDQLEAEREAEIADKPWLSSSSDAPTFDEAKARIEWQAEQASREAHRESGPAGSEQSGPPGEPSSAPPTTGPAVGSGREITSPEERAAAAAAAGARLEMEERERESAARLDAIRAELGIDQPDPPPAEG